MSETQAPAPAATKAKKPLWKKLLKALLIFLISVFVLIAAMPLWTPLLSGVVASQIEKNTGLKTSLGSVSVSLLGGGKVKLKELKIRGEEPADDPDLLNVGEMELAFNLLPLISGRFELEKARLAGGGVAVSRTAEGRYNFAPALERGKKEEPKAEAPAPEPAPEPQPEPTPEPKKEEPREEPAKKETGDDLPFFADKAVIALESFDIQLRDDHEHKYAQIEGATFTLDVTDRSKLAYKGKIDIKELASGEPRRSFGGVIGIDGGATIARAEGAPQVTANGAVTLEGAYLHGLPDVSLDNRSASFKHALSADLHTGIAKLTELSVTSDYLTAKLEEFVLSGLQPLSEQGELAERVRRIDTTGWRGAFRGSFDFDKLQADLGPAIRKLSDQQVQQVGGSMRFSTTIEGKAGGKATLIEAVDLGGVYVKGLKKPYASEPEGTPVRPYAITLSETYQKVTLDVSFPDLILTTLSEVKFSAVDPTTSKPADLYRSTDTVVLEPFLGAKGVLGPFASIQSSLVADLDATGRVLKEVMPSSARLSGRISNVDKVERLKDRTFREVGRTDALIRLEGASRPLKPIEVLGERDLVATLTEAGAPEKVTIKTFHLNSVGSPLVAMKAEGELDLTGQRTDGFLLELMLTLDELEPYLAVFSPQTRCRGVVQHTTRVHGDAEGMTVEGGGSARNLWLGKAPEGGGEAVATLDLDQIAWRTDMSVALTENKPQTLTIPSTQDRYLGLKHPGFEVLVAGVIRGLSDKEGGPVLEGVTLVGEANMEKLPAFVRSKLKDSGFAVGGGSADAPGAVSGRMAFATFVNGSVKGKINVNGHAGFEDMAIAYKSADGGPMFDKKAGVPMGFAYVAEQTRVEGGSALRVGPISFVLMDQTLFEGGVALDPAGNVSGLDGGATGTLRMPRVELNKLAPVLPMLARAHITNAVMEGGLDGLGGNLKTQKDLTGRVLFQLNADSFDLDAYNEMTKKKGTAPAPTSQPTPAPRTGPQPTEAPAPTSQPASAPAPQDEKPLFVLTEEMRNKIRGFKIDVDVNLKQVKLDKDNEAREVATAIDLNTAAVDNQMALLMTGKINPSTDRPGALSITGKGDLNDPNPPFEVAYDIEKLPYNVGVVRRMQNKVLGYVPIPFLQKMDFASDNKRAVTMTMVGTDTWRGVDFRAIKKSLTSVRHTKIQLPEGKFDLGFDVTGFIDPAALGAEVEAQLAPLRKQLEPIETQVKAIQQQIDGVKNTVGELDKQITSVREQSSTIRTVINGLKPLAAFSGDAKKKLEKAEGELGGFDKKIAEYQAQQKAELDKATDFSDQQGRLRGEMDKIRAQIEAKRKELASNLEFDSPFDFDFNEVTIAFSLENESPWDGLGGLSQLAGLPTTKAMLQVMEFQPKGRDFPTLGGWWDLDGKYDFIFKLSDENMEQLGEKVPPLADLIRKQGGVKWTSDGFEPNPLNLIPIPGG
ncbi:MAG: zinc ribbon domain-containing protein [Planctomycetota bacterium]